MANASLRAYDLEAVHDVLPRGLAELANPARAPFETTERVYWPYLLAAVLVSFVVYLVQSAREARGVRGFFVFLFPGDTYKHRSTFVDFAFFFTSKALAWVLVAPWLIALPETFRVTTTLLARAFPHRPIVSTSSIAVDIAFTVVAAIAADFGLFVGHWLMHRVPLLWEFHKVHHSAQVMTPLTVYRQHPVDDILAISMSALWGGIGQGVFAFAIGLEPHLVVVLGLNVVVFAFYVFGFNLRHSHVWVSYGPHISKVFISPAQHQIHHSDQTKHFDKNLGFIFAIWDRVAGTLYVPEGREEVKFGLGSDEDREFLSLWRLYARPFISVTQNGRSMLTIGTRAIVVALAVVSILVAVIVGGRLLPKPKPEATTQPPTETTSVTVR
ncbi:MAG: sterol desaturase family protein [Polyangiaceae bacterium]